MKKTFLSALSAIAALAITKTVLDYFFLNTKWFSLLLTAIIVGIVTFLLPLLVEKVNIAKSIICTGFTVLLMVPFSKAQLNPTQQYWLTFLLILTIALLTDIINGIINHNFYLANLIFDAGICLLANHIISFFCNSIFTLVILVIMFSIVLMINFSFKFSIKRKYLNEEVEKNTIDENDIPIE